MTPEPQGNVNTHILKVLKEQGIIPRAYENYMHRKYGHEVMYMI